MGRRRCCCNCWTWADNFNRADSTDIGSDWDEYGGGDWEIVSNALKETTGTDNSFAISIHQHPKLDLTGIVTVTAKSIVTSAVYGVIIDFYNTSNYLWLSYWTDGTHSYLRLGQVAGGVESSIASTSALDYAPIGEDLTLHFCRSYDGLFGSVEEVPQFETYGCLGGGLPTPGYRAGVANFSTGGETVTFDDFTFSEHLYTNALCPGCHCLCDGYCVPPSLVATIISASGDCASCDGEEAELDWAMTPNGFTWTGAFTPDCWPYKSLEDIILSCLTSACESEMPNFSLCSIDDSVLACGWDPADGSNNCPNEGGNGQACPNDNSYCKPLYLEFGPFDCEEGVPGGGSCSYKIAITERP
jgi:hypothetical protein